MGNVGMTLDRARDRDKEDGPENFWKGLARDAIVAALIVAVILGAMYLYAGVWPPLVVVESSSMQHSDEASGLGVIDTGDMVFQQAATSRESIVTYLEGRANGYATYGDFGDVIIFRKVGSATPIIHRAIMYISLHANGTADVDNLVPLGAEWYATDANDLPTRNPVFLKTLTIRHMGFEHNINMTFSFGGVSVTRAGFVTMGDNNAFRACRSARMAGVDCLSGYDQVSTMPRLQDIEGRARGEIPWIGLIKLVVQPTPSCCSGGWGVGAPKNSWDALLVTLLFLISLPFLLEFAGRGWTKYVSPRLPKIRWPWTKHKAVGTNADMPSDPPEGDGEPPREGSSEP
jgi:signal peptidase